MAKFSGNVGYEVDIEAEPGVWVQGPNPKHYYGDVNRTSSRYQNVDKLNDDLSVSMEISIVADQFAYDNFSHIRYVEYMGTKWTVTNVEVQRPRLILSIGGVYNE